MTQETLLVRAGILTALALVLSCGGTLSETPPAVTGSTDAVGPPKAGDWVKWTHEQKESYMRSAVMPKMGRTFFDFDGAMFPNPNCTLCHAAGAKDQGFKMPDVGLPPLPSNPTALKALAVTEPSVFELMAKTVVPETAALLGEPPYDASTGRGIGCFTCHTKM